MIDIKGIDKAELLAALHNESSPRGMGLLHSRDDMTAADVRAEYDATPEERRRFFWYPDYYHGRPLKADIGGDSFDPRLFDRDNGAGRGAEIVERLRGASTRS